MKKILEQLNCEEALNFLEQYSKAKFNPEHEKTYFWLVTEPLVESESVNSWDIFIGKDLWEHNSRMATRGVNDCKKFLENNKQKFLEAFITGEQDYYAVRKQLELKYPYSRGIKQ